MSYVNGTQSSLGLPSAFADIENPSADPFSSALAYGNGSDSIAPFGLRVPEPVAVGGSPGTANGFSGGALQGLLGGAVGSLLSTLLQSLAEVLSQLGTLVGSMGSGAGATAGVACSPQTRFTNATASSTGDPHDSLTGSTWSGGKIDAHWDDMHGHRDLLDSDSFAGGYRVSTTASTPDSHGVTYNASVSVAGGGDVVTMNGDGSYTVLDDGHAIALAPGVAADLGHGEHVTLSSDGSLRVDNSTASGGSLSTILRSNGRGVDVSAQGSEVDLGGYLVDRGS